MLLALQSFERSPANLVRMDKDNFVLAVPEADSVSEGISPEQLKEMEKDPHQEHQVMHCFMPCTFSIVTLRHICILWHCRRWCVGSCKLVPDGVTDLHEHKIHARGSQHVNDYPDHLNPAGLQDDTQLSEQLSLLLCVISVLGRLDSCSELAWWHLASSLSNALHSVRLVLGMSAVGSCFVESPTHSRPAFVTSEMLSQCWLPLSSTSAVARHEHKA